MEEMGHNGLFEAQRRAIYERMAGPAPDNQTVLAYFILETAARQQELLAAQPEKIVLAVPKVFKEAGCPAFQDVLDESPPWQRLARRHAPTFAVGAGAGTLLLALLLELARKL